MNTEKRRPIRAIAAMLLALCLSAPIAAGAVAPAGMDVEVLEGGSARRRATGLVSGAAMAGAPGADQGGPKAAGKRGGKAGGKAGGRLKARRQGVPTELHIVHPDGRVQIVRGFREPTPRLAGGRGRTTEPRPRDASRGDAWPVTGAGASATHSGPQPAVPLKIIRLRMP